MNKYLTFNNLFQSQLNINTCTKNTVSFLNVSKSEI